MAWVDVDGVNMSSNFEIPDNPLIPKHLISP